MNYEELKTIIYRKNPNELLGLIEGQYFDTKSSPYILKKDSAKHEFVKDVVSFLNAEGGFILLGGATQVNPTHSGEEVSEICWFPKELLSLQQYRGIIADWLYPEPSGIEFIVIEGTGEQLGKLVCVIDIPTQNSSNRPYLIAKCTLEDGGKTDSHIIGYAKRVFDGTKRIEKKDLHKWIQSGQSFEDKIIERLDYLSNLIGQRRDISTQTPNHIEEFLPDRIKSAVQHLNASEERILCLAIYPGENVTIPNIFESRRSPVANLMTSPPVLRESGWDVRCGLNPRIVDGTFLRCGESDRRVLDVYADGTTIFVGIINHDLLAWGSETDSRLHPLALAESIWGVCAFYKELVTHFSQNPEKVLFQISLQNLRLSGVSTTLPPYQIGSVSFHYGTDDHEAPDDVCFAKSQVNWNEYDPDAVAYTIVKAIYVWFGFTEAEIPYVQAKGEVKVLDTEAMIKPVRG